MPFSFLYSIRYSYLYNIAYLIHTHIYYTSYPSLDIIPDIACFDEGGSRFIHKRLKLGTIEEQELAMKVALSAIEELWSHHFGNFMLQGIFEFGTDEMKKELMEYIYNTQDVAALCVHMNG